jgi:hypothetical protein
LSLEALPHRIPFRAVSTVEIIDERRARGSRLLSGGDALQQAPQELMIIEAMAQIAGALAFSGSGRTASLAGIEAFTIDELPQAGDELSLEAELVATFGRIHRFEGKAFLRERSIARGRFYLSDGIEQ